MNNLHLVLASESPRRRQLLSMLGYDFEVAVPGIDETIPPDAKPAEAARALAIRKTREVAKRMPTDAVVIGADTIVVYRDRILGKPTDADDAVRMLSLLSGRSHRVITGLCVKRGGRELSTAEETRVFFTPLTIEQKQAYVATGEPLDKAGAYAIQGGAGKFIRRIEGCYYNVVGLPLSALNRMLRSIIEGTDIPDSRQ